MFLCYKEDKLVANIILLFKLYIDRYCESERERKKDGEREHIGWFLVINRLLIATLNLVGEKPETEAIVHLKRGGGL